MKFVNKNNGLPLFIEEDLLIELGQIGIQHFPNEFGGFLIGHYSYDLSSVIVNNYLLPKAYKGFPFLLYGTLMGWLQSLKKYSESRNYIILENGTLTLMVPLLIVRLI